MLTKLLSGFVMITALTLSVTPEAKAQTTNFVQIPCSGFSGAGTFSNPVVIGLVNTPVNIINCPALSSGSGFSSRFYLISLPASRTSNAVAGAVTNLIPGAISAVHPQLSELNGIILLTSLRDGFWVGNPDVLGAVGRFIPLTTVRSGTYLLRFDKVDSPLRSLQTPNFNIVIIP